MKINLSKKFIFLGLISIFIITSLVMFSFASEEKDYINRALKLIDEEKYNEAVGELEEALMVVRSKAKLEYVNVLFAEEIEGFGIYNPRENATFTQGEIFIIYGEPRNFSAKEVEKGFYEIYLKEDLYILDQDNNILFGQIDFGEFHNISHQQNSEIIFTTTVEQIDPFPIGNYKFRLVLKDVFSQKTTEVTIDFTVVE
ncbi:hypothetical protein ES704_00372 [subsurface metagenome]|jgi:hypothetical protein